MNDNERDGEDILHDEFGEEYVLDANGNRRTPRTTGKKDTSSGFTTYDTSGGHCGLCGRIDCNGGCFK